MHFSFVGNLGYCCEGACFPKFQGVKQTSDKRHYNTHRLFFWCHRSSYGTNLMHLKILLVIHFDNSLIAVIIHFDVNDYVTGWKGTSF